MCNEEIGFVISCKLSYVSFCSSACGVSGVCLYGQLIRLQGSWSFSVRIRQIAGNVNSRICRVAVVAEGM